MKQLSFFFIVCTLLVSCNNKAYRQETIENNIVNESEAQEYCEIEDADKELRDSINCLQYNPDENGICSGAPDLYDAKNTEEEKLLSSFDKCFKAITTNDVPKVKSFICPKVISLAKEKFPQYSDDDIDDFVTKSIEDFSELKDFIKSHFEGFKKIVPAVTQLYKLPSKDGCLLYSVHYSTVILCSADDENYYACHIPMFTYAASYDNGGNWYFIELVEDTNEVLKDFR